MGARLVVLLATLARTLLGQTMGQRASDTTKYVLLFSDRPAGFYKEWVSDGALHSVYEYNDRSRGPHLEAVLRVDSDDFPTAMTIVGHGYLKDTVAEQFSVASGTATWKSHYEQGSQSDGAHAFYVSAAESPTGTQQLVQACLKKGRVALLPGGTAWVERAGDLTIQAGGRPVHLTLYENGGIGFSPFPVWLADDGQRFATVSEASSMLPEDWEPAIPPMVALQDRWANARYRKLAADLAHRPSSPVVIRHANLFVAESALVRPEMTIVLSGNRITAVGPDAQVVVPPGAQLIDASGKTLLPGLWDMHVHIGPGDDGLLFIAAGVTSARDMGNDTVTVLELQRRFATDSLIGPRLMLAGLIDGSGPYQSPNGIAVDDSAAARRAVDWYAAHGYEQIKIYSSVRPELVPGIIAAARAHGLRVSGHVPAFMRAEDVVLLGFNEVQHANFLMLNFMDSVRDTRTMVRATAVAQHGAELDFSSTRVRDFIALVKSRDVDIDPTLVVFENRFMARPGQLDPSEVAIADRMPPQVRRGFYEGGLPVPPGMDQRYRDSYAALLHMVKAMYDAGVPVVAGTDYGPWGFSLLREFELYVQAGIPANRVLQLATIGAARIMHHDYERGSVAPGKLADLLLVDGNPAQHISDIRRTALVIKNGLIYRPSEFYGVLGIGP
jgi:imidazolonepropionase-like amidohydrolase